MDEDTHREVDALQKMAEYDYHYLHQTPEGEYLFVWEGIHVIRIANLDMLCWWANVLRNQEMLVGHLATTPSA